MSEGTNIFKKGGETLKEHKKTVLGGVGGASLVGVLAVVMPYVNDLNESNARQWERISQLTERIVRLETQVEMLKEKQ